MTNFSNAQFIHTKRPKLRNNSILMPTPTCGSNQRLGPLELASRRKLIYCSPYIWKKIFLFKQSFVFKGTERNIFNRASVVPYAFVNLPVKIYSGKRWHIRLINEWMVGYKFGEFTWNRKLALYKAKQLKKLKKKKKLSRYNGLISLLD